MRQSFTFFLRSATAYRCTYFSESWVKRKTLCVMKYCALASSTYQTCLSLFFIFLQFSCRGTTLFQTTSKTVIIAFLCQCIMKRWTIMEPFKSDNSICISLFNSLLFTVSRAERKRICNYTSYKIRSCLMETAWRTHKTRDSIARLTPPWWSKIGLYFLLFQNEHLFYLITQF